MHNKNNIYRECNINWFIVKNVLSNNLKMCFLWTLNYTLKNIGNIWLNCSALNGLNQHKEKKKFSWYVALRQNCSNGKILIKNIINSKLQQGLLLIFLHSFTVSLAHSVVSWHLTSSSQYTNNLYDSTVLKWSLLTNKSE